MASEKTGNGVYDFFKARWGELSNVTWPTKKQAIHSMILVLTIMLIVGLFLGFIDAVLSNVLLDLIS